MMTMSLTVSLVLTMRLTVLDGDIDGGLITATLRGLTTITLRLTVLEITGY